LDSVADNFRAGGLREFGKFVERLAEFRAVAVFQFDADEKNPFGAFAGEIDERFQLLRPHNNTKRAARDFIFKMASLKIRAERVTGALHPASYDF
jgi:hypothetical protein